MLWFSALRRTLHHPPLPLPLQLPLLLRRRRLALRPGAVAWRCNWRRTRNRSLVLPGSSLAAFGKSPAARGSRDGPRTPPKRRSTAGTALRRTWGAVDGGRPSWLVLVLWGVGRVDGGSVGQVGTAGGARTDHQHGSSHTWGAAVGVAVGAAVGVGVRDLLVLVWGRAGNSVRTRMGSVRVAPEEIAGNALHRLGCRRGRCHGRFCGWWRT
jgi:hypothetical protein